MSYIQNKLGKFAISYKNQFDIFYVLLGVARIRTIVKAVYINSYNYNFTTFNIGPS